MNNFIVRTITAVFFVAAIVCSFLRPEAMVLLFALITGLTVWEFTGLVNQREGVTTNRMICTVAGVYFFLAMAGYSSELTPSAVFIPYLVTLIYLMVEELYLKHEDPINNWAYTMMSQLYIALPFSRILVGQAQALPSHLSGKILGRQHRRRHPRDGCSHWRMVSHRTIWRQPVSALCHPVGRSWTDGCRLRHLGRPHRVALQAHPWH